MHNGQPCSKLPSEYKKNIFFCFWRNDFVEANVRSHLQRNLHLLLSSESWPHRTINIYLHHFTSIAVKSINLIFSRFLPFPLMLQHFDNMYRTHFICLLLAIHGIKTIITLPQGAPESVCHTMLPHHGGGIPPAASRSPFRIVPNSVFINQGKMLFVEIEPQIPELTFGGFMIHARSINPPYQVVSWIESIKCG